MERDLNFADFNYLTREDTQRDAACELVVGDQYAMRVDGQKWVRVLLITPTEVNKHGEKRAHVVVLEDNLYVRSGAECRPLAFTLSQIPSAGR